MLDITQQVTFRGEQGLLGLALHPTDPTRLFVHYSNRAGHTVVSEFSLSDDGRTADPNSERIVFFARQPATNHNGGMIQFGPDGFLYLGLGDGGGAGDRYGHGQRPDTPLAALVRIDPDQLTSQVWWFGLRNPWRFWIDHPTGLTYTADVGQDAYEEINVAPLSEPGLNFGWPITEGLHCYQPRRDCDSGGPHPAGVGSLPQRRRNLLDNRRRRLPRLRDARPVRPLLLLRLLRRLPPQPPLERNPRHRPARMDGRPGPGGLLRDRRRWRDVRPDREHGLPSGAWRLIGRYITTYIDIGSSEGRGRISKTA